MTELLYQHPHYQLLLNSQRRGWCPIDKTTLAITCIVTVPMIIFCTIYMLLFGVYETVVYPSNFNSFEVPKTWLSRAILYSELNANASLSPHSSKHYFRLPESNYLPQNDYKLVCYYNFPDDNMNDLYVYKLDPNICTHINVANADVVNNTLYLSEPRLKVLTSVIQLKKFNENLKVLLTVTAFGNNNSFADMVYNHTNRKVFIKSVLYYVRTYKIDGIDIDWEFPNDNEGSDKHQVMHFTQLLEELRIVITRQARHKFLVSVAVAAPIVVADVSYEIGPMSRFVDYVNLMTYDYHFFTKYTPFTGLNSPLYPLASEKGYLTTLNINYSANFWQSMGMDKSKIIIGLPTYGHTFTLTNSRNNGIYSPAIGYGKLGHNGFVDYNQICTFLYANQIAPIFETDAKSPYATKGSEWISFEDEQSMMYKAEYIRDNHYGGAMIFSLNADDHRGLCKINGRSNGMAYPLTRTVRKVLFGKKNTAGGFK